MLIPASLLAAAQAAAIMAAPCPPAIQMPAEVAAYRVAMMASRHSAPPARPTSAIAAFAAAQAERQRQDWPFLCRFAADNARLALRPAAERQVVFLGDSITENWAVARPDLAGRGWVNRGISGQTTPQILLRFQQDVVALRPRVVHIMAGTNDVAGNTGPNTAEAVEDNIRAMVRLGKAAGIRVVLAAIPPAARFAWAPDLRPGPVIAAMNDRLRKLAASEYVLFVDYGRVLATADGAMRPELSYDGVHPDGAGYAAMMPVAERVVARALR